MAFTTWQQASKKVELSTTTGTQRLLRTPFLKTSCLTKWSPLKMDLKPREYNGTWKAWFNLRITSDYPLMSHLMTKPKSPFQRAERTKLMSNQSWTNSKAWGECLKKNLPKTKTRTRSDLPTPMKINLLVVRAISYQTTWCWCTRFYRYLWLSVPKKTCSISHPSSKRSPFSKRGASSKARSLKSCSAWAS